MMKKRLEKTLQRKFSAIIFDVDGVLAEPYQEISQPMVEAIVNILNKNVYVSIVSGRARYIPDDQQARGIKCLDEVFNKIKQSPTLNSVDNLKYLFGYEQNGAAMFSEFNGAPPIRKDVFLDDSRMDKNFQKNIWNSLSSAKNPMFDYAELKTHSIALWLNEKYKTSHKKNIAEDAIKDVLTEFGESSHFELFQTEATIDINFVDVSKATAVDFYIKAGFTLSQIARVGDSTFLGGNDLPMVQYNGVGDDGGFSVIHYDELDAFPIISLPKAIEKSGVSATHWLLDNIRFNEDQPYLFN